MKDAGLSKSVCYKTTGGSAPSTGEPVTIQLALAPWDGNDFTEIFNDVVCTIVFSASSVQTAIGDNLIYTDPSGTCWEPKTNATDYQEPWLTKAAGMKVIILKEKV